jgi:hypothetical protein
MMVSCCPKPSKALESAQTASASPPVLAKGETSEETMAIEQLALGCPGRAFRVGDFCAFVLGLARSMPSPFLVHVFLPPLQVLQFPRHESMDAFGVTL